MTPLADIAPFLAETRFPGPELPEAPLAMPEQDLSHPQAGLGWAVTWALAWRRMRGGHLVRN